MSETLVLAAALVSAGRTDELSSIVEARRILSRVTTDPHTRAGTSGQVILLHRTRPDILRRLIESGEFTAEAAAALAAIGGAMVREVTEILEAPALTTDYSG